jgi:hypothetical protein
VSVNLYDEAGTSRTQLVVTQAVAGLALFDEAGTHRAILTDQAGAGLAIYDRAGTPRAVLDVDEGNAALHVADRAGTERAVLGSSKTVRPDGKVMTRPESSLLLVGPEGNVIWEAPQ